MDTPYACHYCPPAVTLYKPLTVPAFIALFLFGWGLTSAHMVTFSGKQN